MTTFVLVPGGWRGGWTFDPITQPLREAGHQVWPVTLAGLGDDDPPTAAVNLDTHIDQVADLLDREDLTDVHLCGHSYGGMVIAGVADRLPRRIARLVHIDAYVPKDGDSCFTLTSEAFRRTFLTGATGDGLTVPPPPGPDPRRRPHPLATFLQSVRLTGAAHTIRRRTLIHASGWPATPFTDQFERLSRDPAWETHVLDCGHDVMAHRPADLLAILTS